MNDLRYAFRMLLKNPIFTMVAALSLALGIGANTALFSVVYGVLINPYPYAKPGEMWWPSAKGLKPVENRMSYRLGEYLDLAKLPVFSETMATSQGNMLLTGEFAPENLQAVRLTGGAFHFLGVPPVAGRVIGTGDIRPNGEAEPVVVVSYRTWQRLFDGSLGALGKTMRLNDVNYTVIGIMPPRFGWYGSDAVWLPLTEDRRDMSYVNPLVRLKQGVSPAAAEQQLHLLHQEMARATPGEFFKDGFTTRLTNYLDLTVASGDMRTSLQLLFGAVGLLLLIACANVANLQLARATSRAREMAIRLSVGAGRGRLVRQLLTESVLLSLLGGALGLLFAFWLTNFMVALMPGSMVPNESRVEINGSVLFFCVIVSMLTGILFGLVPALRSTRPDLTEALKDGARGAGTAERPGRTRGWLVVGEVALAVVLLLCGALTARSFNALQKVDLGFRPERLVMVNVPLDRKRYATFEKRNRFDQELLERVGSLPDVESAAIGNGGLPFGGPDSTYAIEGRSDGETRRMNVNLVSADYIKTLGIPLRRGRMPTGREIDDAVPVAVVNEAAAGLWGPGEDPIGKRLRLDLLTNANPNLLAPLGSGPYVTIVGVIGNTRNDGLSGELPPASFVPYTLLAPPQRTLAVRAKGDEKRLMNLLQAQAVALDPRQPLGRSATIEVLLGFQTGQPRFIMALFSLFAALGLALAVAGIYSMLSYLVTRRSHEIGVRMALGARRGDVLGLIMKAGGRLVAAGLAIGLPAGFGAAQLLRSQLFKVTPLDAPSCLGVVAALGAVAAAACYIPARRATKVDPMVALRCE
jgi:putative ABC transport system permease protein